MNEENNTPKNKWSRIFRKKWFYPALYLSIAALLLAGVLWYQNVNSVPDALDELEEAEDYNPMLNDRDDAEPVVDQQEVIKMPIADEEQAEIVTKFYDYNADQEDQENGLVLYNNRYYQSTGIDISLEEDRPFDVVASLSGTVTEVKEDPLLGHVVILSHEDNVMTYYASLGEVDVQAGDRIKQGDKVGSAGKNLFGQENGTHVHFELRKDDKTVNPEEYFNQPVSKLEDISKNDEDVEGEDDSEPEEDDDIEDPDDPVKHDEVE